MQRVLIVDDDAAVRSAMRTPLQRAGFEVAECEDGDAALDRVAHEQFAVMILDVEMPRLDGWKTLARLRARRWSQPVLMVTHINDIDSRVHGLETGADDYLGKPFDTAELLARVRAVLRRGSTPTAPVSRLRFGPVVVDLAAKRAERDGHPVQLTRTEFGLLAVLAGNLGLPLARHEIYAAVWGAEPVTSHTLDTHLWRLRQKLGDVGHEPQWIQNRPGIGYVLAAETAGDESTTRTSEVPR